MTPQELCLDTIPEVSVTQTNKARFSSTVDVCRTAQNFRRSGNDNAHTPFTFGFSTFHNNFLDQQRPAQYNINAIMCVVSISYSCGAISHRSLRDHEAGFLSQPRLEVCDCDRVMNVPTSMMARCPICARQAAKQYRERGQTAGDYSGEGQQEEPLIHEAGAGEVEVSGEHDRGQASDP